MIILLGWIFILHKFQDSSVKIFYTLEKYRKQTDCNNYISVRLSHKFCSKYPECVKNYKL